jgi:hypothetical protein
MSTRQKVGLTLVAFSILATFALQVAFACLYRPDAVLDAENASLTTVVFIQATNWLFVLPLCVLFVGGLFCFLVPRRSASDEPQLVEIKYMR